MLGDALKHQSLRDLVVQRIRRAIFEGELELGSRLVETAVAAKLGVSRAPVREAFLDLAREGLLVMHPRRGASVSTLSPEQIWQIYALRAHLEALLIEHGLQRITAADLDYLTALAEEMGRVTADVSAVSRAAELDMAFHSRIAALCPYERIVEAYHALDGQIWAGIYTVVKVLNAEPLMRMKDRHLDVVEGLRSGDPVTATRILQHHWMETAERLRLCKSAGD